MKRASLANSTPQLNPVLSTLALELHFSPFPVSTKSPYSFSPIETHAFIFLTSILTEQE